MDQVLFRQGDISNGCGYLLVYGLIELSDMPSKQKIGGLKSGDSIGEDELLKEEISNIKKSRGESAVAK